MTDSPEHAPQVLIIHTCSKRHFLANFHKQRRKRLFNLESMILEMTLSQHEVKVASNSLH